MFIIDDKLNCFVNNYMIAYKFSFKIFNLKINYDILIFHRLFLFFHNFIFRVILKRLDYKISFSIIFS